MSTSSFISVGPTGIDPKSLPTVNDLYKSQTIHPHGTSLADPSPPLNDLISIYRGSISDIANLQTDALVAATTIPPGPSPPCVPQPHKAITHAAGPAIVSEFIPLAKDGVYKPGFPILTAGHKLQARSVVHAWAPRAPADIMDVIQPWRELAECYIKALELGRQREWKTMAFMALCSDGGDRTREGMFPSRQAAMMACRQVRRFLQFNPDAGFERIVFFIDDEHDYDHYRHWIPLFFPVEGGDDNGSDGNEGHTDP